MPKELTTRSSADPLGHMEFCFGNYGDEYTGTVKIGFDGSDITMELNLDGSHGCIKAVAHPTPLGDFLEALGIRLYNCREALIPTSSGMTIHYDHTW